MAQQIVIKLDSNQKHYRKYHTKCQTYLRSIYYHDFSNFKHKERKLGMYCTKCNHFYPDKKIKVIQ